MSITDEIQARIRAHHGKRLFYLPLRFRGDPAIRIMIVSEEVRDAVRPPWPKNWEGLRQSGFRGTLDAFTRGERVSVAERPFDKPNYAFLARVDPVADEVWDIRSIDPNPGIRCLGGFGGKDFFIALTWNYREILSGEYEWRDELQRCKSDWKELFDQIPRFHEGALDGYLSNYFAV